MALMKHYTISVIILIIMVGCTGCGGKESTSQTPTIAVDGGGTGGGNSFIYNTTLSWDAPTANIDGSNLTVTDLVGYKVYYGNNAGGSMVFGNVITLSNVTTVTIPNLTLGTYCFAVTAYNAGGDESDYSNIVSKTVDNSGNITYETCQ